MRSLLCLSLLLASTAAMAQVATDHISVSDTPFQAQSPVGDGVHPAAAAPVAAPANVAATASGAASFGLAKVFDEADINHDNVVTKEEFMAKAERHFGMADTNKDGKITREEMQAQQNAVMQQMQRNLFGGGNAAGGWQNKLNQFIGAPTTPTTPTVSSPTAPVAPSVN